MPAITRVAPAKINLFLHITGRRDDGYHNLQTVFRRIDLFDTLIFTLTDRRVSDASSLVNFTSNLPITEHSNDNLIVKAALALVKTALDQDKITPDNLTLLPVVDIYLDKKIPMGAGLGGGSSDCATTLMTLNDLWQLGFANTTLMAIGVTLGADVPIFIFAQDAIAEGIGDKFTPITLPPQRLLLLMPADSIHTATLFAHPALRRDCPSIAVSQLLSHADAFTNTLTTGFGNVFEPVVRQLSPTVDSALGYLNKLSVMTKTTPRMSGTGSSVFLPIPSDIDDATCQLWQDQAPCLSRLCHTLP